MNFKAVSVWAELSDCGNYTVSLAKVGDRFSHQAWKKPEGRGIAELLGTFEKKDDARACCRGHQERA